MQKPKVTVNCVANRYAGPNERIIEFSAPNGAGGLIALRIRNDGLIVVDVYRCNGVVMAGQR
jgi:hypothetical protein